jgi:alpha-amylase/alpha-mannosidase (GH57 family)
MHQPDYREPGSDRLAMPWVRLHAIKDYLDMPLTATSYEDVRVTFNLVPSLIDQLELYCDGGTDRHLDLSRKPAQELSPDERLEVLQTFFSAHQHTMVEVHPRYAELYEKFAGSTTRTDVLPALFTSAEMRDLQVWSNLTWVDPTFRHEEPIATLLAKERHFTEEDKTALLDWQINLIRRIVPTYKSLLDEGRIEVSFTPYYHPILPLLCDTDVAREALPGIHLPGERFAFPEDADRHIALACERYEQLFGRKLKGMWPSEGSVSEQTLELIAGHGITWTASDERVLYQSLAKSSLDKANHPLHAVYDYGGLRLFFRDQALSDRIGFVYSSWTAQQAVSDFVGHLHRIRELLSSSLERTVVPIILDGENAWDFFPDDGTEFLRTFYRSLSADPLIELVTMSEAAETQEPYSLPRVFAGSWINNNFRIWIGHAEDNAAWDLLSRARSTLVKTVDKNDSVDPVAVKTAWNQIYRAEGSDWCWWYGDEHRGPHNRHFDQIFRRHLQAVYETLGLEIPMELARPIHSETAVSYTVMPDDILTAQIDGRVSHFYEWAGAGHFDCTKAGNAMHRGDRLLSGIHFAFDHNRFYIRLDFNDRQRLDLLEDPQCEVALFSPSPIVVRFPLRTDAATGGESGQWEYALGEILELAVARDFLWQEEFGSLGFTISLYDGERLQESWPESQPVQLDVPEKNREIFWPR